MNITIQKWLKYLKSVTKHASAYTALWHEDLNDNVSLAVIFLVFIMEIFTIIGNI
jgi:hypothetical protein